MHGAVQEARLDRSPAKMRERRQTVEHPFGTIKSWMGGHSLPDENAQARRHRNGPARSGLQHETVDAHAGRWRIDRGDPSIIAASHNRTVPPDNHNIRVFTRPGPISDIGSQLIRRCRLLARLRHTDAVNVCLLDTPQVTDIYPSGKPATRMPVLMRSHPAK